MDPHLDSFCQQGKKRRIYEETKKTDFHGFFANRNTKTVQCLKEGTNGIFFNNSTPLTSLTFKWVSPSVSSEIVKRITFMFTIKKVVCIKSEIKKQMLEENLELII